MLDTNVLLDWWVFRDPRVAAVARAVEHGAVRWLACARMRDEFAHQLARPQLARWAPDAAAALAAMDALAEMRPPPAILRPAPAPRCRDPDDQVFVDLALDAGARWLLTQDRDLLALARRGARAGDPAASALARGRAGSRSAGRRDRAGAARGAIPVARHPPQRRSQSP